MAIAVARGLSHYAMGEAILVWIVSPENEFSGGVEILGLFSSDLVIRDQSTGESRTFDRSREGYASARNFEDKILARGHCVGDDGTGSLNDIEDYLGPSRKESGGGWLPW